MTIYRPFANSLGGPFLPLFFVGWEQSHESRVPHILHAQGLMNARQKESGGKEREKEKRRKETQTIVSVDEGECRRTIHAG